MAHTISYRVVGTVKLLLHTKAPPDVAEYDEFLSDLEPLAGTTVTAVFVYSFGGGPNASQRKKTSELWKRRGTDPRIVLVTPSALARGIATALSWLMSVQIVAFSPHQLDTALQTIGFAPDEIPKARRALDAMCADVGLELAA